LRISGNPTSPLGCAELIQQGAVNAVSFLIAHGCTEAVANDMFESLRESASAVRAEIERRGESPLFGSDQLAGDAPPC